MKVSRPALAHVALLVVNLIYGANYTIAKEVMPLYIGPSGFIVLRVVVALALFQLVRLVAIREKVQFKDWPLLIMCGLCGVAINQLMFFQGLAITTPINAAIIMTVNPVLVLIIASILLKERITWLRILGIVTGLAGAAMLILYNQQLAINASTWRGDLFIFINALSYGVYLVIVKPLMARYHPITVISFVFLTGAVFVLPFGYTEFVAVDWAGLPSAAWYAIAFVVLATTFTAYLLNTVALKTLSPSVVSIYIYLQPLFATAIALATARDQLNAIHVLSAALIFTGVFLVSYRRYPTVYVDNK